MSSTKLLKYALWLLLSLPGVWLIWLWVSGDSSAHYLLLPSGKYAIRAALVALAVTPLRLIFPRAKWVLWLLKTRRAWGVASCGYAALHTVFYLIDEGGLAGALGDISDAEIIIGWLAMLVFIVLAATSNNWSVKKLGRRWKTLQRAAYLAIVFSFLHWFLLGFYQIAMWTHLLPLVLLQALRVYLQTRIQPSQKAVSLDASSPRD